MINLIFTFLLLGHGGGERAEVLNDMRPKQKHSIEFVEDLRFGTEEDEDVYLWSSLATTLTVDAEGKIYVTDRGDNRILVFDTNGKFLRRLAGPGEGPGELQALKYFQILADGSAIALEGKPGVMPRLQFFDKNLEFSHVKQANFSRLPGSGHFSPLGTWFGGSYVMMDLGKGETVSASGILDLELNPKKELHATSSKLNMNMFSSPDALVDFVATAMKGDLSPEGVVAFDAEGHVYTAMSNRYSITKWSPDLSKKLLVFGREYEPKAYTQNDLQIMAQKRVDGLRSRPVVGDLIGKGFTERVLRAFENPGARNPIVGMICGEGMLFSVHHVDLETGEQQADVFDKTGKFIGQVSLPDWSFLTPGGTARMVFANGYAYTIATNAEEENQVVRYKLQISR